MRNKHLSGNDPNRVKSVFDSLDFQKLYPDYDPVYDVVHKDGQGNVVHKDGQGNVIKKSRSLEIIAKRIKFHRKKRRLGGKFSPIGASNSFLRKMTTHKRIKQIQDAALVQGMNDETKTKK